MSSIFETDIKADQLADTAVLRTKELMAQSDKLRDRREKANRKRVARLFKDPKARSLQRKVHPEEEEGFGLYYVYTYDEVPTENQLRNSHLVYVCCEDVEVEDEINKGTIILPSGKPKFVNWYSKNKGSGTHLLGTFRAVVSKDNKYFKKIKEHGFTHPNRIKKEIKPQIFGLNKKENDVEPKND